MLKNKLTQVIVVATIAAGFVVVGCAEDVDPSTPGDPDRAKPKTTETKKGDGEVGPSPEGGKGSTPVGTDGLPPVPGK